MELKLIKEANGLTVGKEYKVLDQSGNYVQVKNDSGVKTLVTFDKFENPRVGKKKK